MELNYFLTQSFLVAALGLRFSNGDCFTYDIYGRPTYSGTISITVSGRTCQRWDAMYPHEPNYPMSSEHKNYCRNPDGDIKFWCYTMDPYLRWEYCDVPGCGLPTVFTTRTTYHPVTVTDTAKTRHLVKTTDTTQITTEATTTHHTLETTDTTRIATTTQHPLKTTEDTTRITTVATATPGTFQRETTPKNIYSSADIINVLEETTPTSTGNCMCSCTTARQMFWWDFYHGNYTVQEKAAILEVERQRLRSELLVNKSSLTSVIRSRTSAKDERPTAKSIGYIGVVLLICICIIFPCIDLLNFIITKYINKKA